MNEVCWYLLGHKKAGRWCDGEPLGCMGASLRIHKERGRKVDQSDPVFKVPEIYYLLQ
jgi:hypothetical protein